MPRTAEAGRKMPLLEAALHVGQRACGPAEIGASLERGLRANDCDEGSPLDESCMSPSASFDQAAYWIKRHRDFLNDPRSVGNMAVSKRANEQGEAVLAKIVQEAAGLARVPRSVLDVGCGYGRVTASFIASGFDYTGIDVSPDAIAEARRRHPGQIFFVADITSWQAPRRFGLVSVLYVFVHFVDDVHWELVLERMLDWIEPGGGLLFADQFRGERSPMADHVVVRPLASYVPVFDRLGFMLDDDFRSSLAARCSDIGLTPYLDLVGHFYLARRHG
jgi:SAM-dependent methyltransferase